MSLGLKATTAAVDIMHRRYYEARPARAGRRKSPSATRGFSRVSVANIAFDLIALGLTISHPRVTKCRTERNLNAFALF
jgi:hypothetical protein